MDNQSGMSPAMASPAPLQQRPGYADTPQRGGGKKRAAFSFTALVSFESTEEQEGRRARGQGEEFFALHNLAQP